MFVNSPRKKFFILGLPGVGKTTLVKHLFQFLKKTLPEFDLTGFITEEIREEGERKGFKLKPLDNSKKELILSLKKDLLPPEEVKKRPSVGKYAVMLENLEKLIDELEKKIQKASSFFVIDEIGKMEALSPKFCRFIELLLNSQNYLLATVGKGDLLLLKKVRKFEPAFLCEVTKENRDFLRERLEIEFFRKGKLIVVEGIDGSGKTTFSKVLYEKLKEKKKKVMLSCEPTSGPFGKKIREILGKKKGDAWELRSLFLKDRMWHVKNLIIPALKEGRWVVLDRYYLSTLAYQTAQGFSLKELLIENETIAPIPDLVIYLDLPLDIAFKRMENRKKDLSLFEKEGFLKKVKKNYEDSLKLFNHLVIDATKSLEENVEDVLKVLNSKFEGSLS